MVAGATHFAQRESGAIVVDLFWKQEAERYEFRLEVKDRREGYRFVLYPATGRDAIQAFCHPFAATKAVR